MFCRTVRSAGPTYANALKYVFTEKRGTLANSLRTLLNNLVKLFKLQNPNNFKLNL
jgi:hypothetical protein